LRFHAHYWLLWQWWSPMNLAQPADPIWQHRVGLLLKSFTSEHGKGSVFTVRLPGSSDS
jgi:PhoPQ-activated pathogenicity-related protein